jgi:hypothetical protein
MRWPALSPTAHRPVEEAASFTRTCSLLHRSHEPIFERLVNDDAMRRILTPVEDVLLAEALFEVDRGARQEAQMFDGWYGFQSASIIDFVNRLIPSAE